MSMAEHTTESLQITPDPETLHAFHRQQLSAMLDGELPADEAKFMLRRLEHDTELARCWDRWQVCGEVLRGRADGLLSTDFAARVALAVQVPPPRSGGDMNARQHSHRIYWGGVGIAASLALVVSVMVVALPEKKHIPGYREVAASDISSPVSLPAAAATDAIPSIAAPPEAMAGTGQVSADEVAAASTASIRVARELLDPAATHSTVVPRPWPRAGIGTGPSTVGYGGSSMPTDPFQPRWAPPPSVFWPESGTSPAVRFPMIPGMKPLTGRIEPF